MNLQVINRELCVNTLNVEAVSSSSLLLIGDASTIQLASTFDTPAESLIIGPFVPLTPKG
ncbi:spore gernimation protein GerPD [Rossellomorea vietnamensis]|uniref:Spore gernimation protein GerPD n=1 Tax=Rossellomorea vietnamensis TaxID=218284 RepID=A0A5D4MEP4_9BACI|nr:MULTISPECIES: spore gernimation protein GerPD [Bacillaceae]TYR99470.1 spore gernimation protein GerPD [Rossellomorea vietnamensis]